MIEIRVRVLLKSDLGMDVVPGTTLVATNAPDSLNVAKVKAALLADLTAPQLGQLRPMTAEEADAFFEQERIDEEADCSDLGLSDADLAVPS